MNTLLSVFLIFGLGVTEFTLILLILFVPYFIPSIIARNKVNFTGILLLNIFLGWTLLGWVGALIWAITDKSREEMNRTVKMEINPANTQKKFKCRFCGFEHYELTTFCPVCAKDENGFTLEEYRKKTSSTDKS
ncbi:MAG: superinfection immunity protein [Bacteroidales bacterium]|nr:superinfection immunity protein [Bacteroidales bacterium]